MSKTNEHKRANANLAKLLAGTSLVLFYTCGGAFAAQTESTKNDAGPVLEELIVTAQKRAESIQTVPITMHAFSGDDLARGGVDNLAKLQQMAPGVVLGNTSTYAAFFVRGVGNSISTPAAESPVAIYVDGVYISDISSMMFGLEDVERVELLKGPQGSLYGRNAVAGAVNVITKSPKEGLEGDIKLTGGNFKDRGVSTYIAGGSAKIKGSLAFSYQKRDGYYKNLAAGKPDLEGVDQWSTRGKLVLSPSDKVTLTLSADYAKQDDTQNTGLQAGDIGGGVLNMGVLFGGHTTTEPWKTYLDAPLSNHAKYKGLSLRGNFDFDGFSVLSISAYRDTKITHGIDMDATDAPVASFLAHDTHNQYSQEIQILSTGTTKFSWVAGVYYLRDNAAFDPLQLNFIGTPLISIEGKVRGDSFAAFGEATYKFTDSLSLTAGARYSHDKKELRQLDQTVAGVPAFPGSPTFVGPTDQKTWERVTPRVSLKLQRDEGIYYITASEGYKAGTYNLAGPDPVSNNAVNPEKLKSIEAGAKWNFQDRVQLNLAGYYYDYKDLQVQTFGGNSNVTILQNAANAKVKGVEAEVTAKATQDLLVHASAAYLNAKYNTFPNASIFVPNTLQQFFPLSFVNASVDRSGARMPRSPEFTFSAGANWDLPIAREFGTFTLSGNWYHSDKYFTETSQNITSPSYNLFNADLTFRSIDKRWMVSIWGKNLSQAKYLQTGADLQFAREIRYGEPRMYGLTLGFNFGS